MIFPSENYLMDWHVTIRRSYCCLNKIYLSISRPNLCGVHFMEDRSQRKGKRFFLQNVIDPMALINIPGLTLDALNGYFYTFGNKRKKKKTRSVTLAQVLIEAIFSFLMIFNKSASTKNFIFSQTQPFCLLKYCSAGNNISPKNRFSSWPYRIPYFSVPTLMSLVVFVLILH